MKGFVEAFVRGIAYAIAFALVLGLAAYFFWPFAPSKARTQQDPRVAAYYHVQELQHARSEKLLDRTEQYYDRVDKDMLKQEELQKRFERVIAGWESGQRRPPAKQP